MDEKATGRTPAPVLSVNDGMNKTDSGIRTQKFSLRNNIVFWETNLNASSFVLNVLRQGYIIPFTSPPPAFYARNNGSAMRNPDFVSGAIDELLSEKFITEVKSPPHCCNPLTVSERGRLRIVLDLRHLNRYIKPNKFLLAIK